MGRSLILILVTLAVIGQRCYGGAVGGRIYNGQSASPGQFPYQVLLMSFIHANPRSYNLCGGSLISRNYVLTVAHCVKDTDATNVYLGVTYMKDLSNATLYTVDHDPNVMQHPDFNEGSPENDIAVIKLPEEVTLSRFIQTVALPKLAWADPKFFDNYEVTASGFGMKHNDDHDLPHYNLQFAHLFIMPHDECRNLLYRVTDGMICTDKRVKSGICPGDSGSPLVVRYQSELYVIGAADWIISPCVNPFPGVYTYVAHYLQWIHQMTNLAIS